MSELPLAALAQENTQLKSQLENAINQVNSYVAQLDAHKQMLSESIQSSLSLRATLIVFQKNIQDLNKQLADANAKIAELTPKE